EGAVLGAVGAFDWSGGAFVYSRGEQSGTFINSTKDQTDMKDSYLGYALQQVARDAVAVGAPRYQHTGRVLIFTRHPTTSAWRQRATATGEK
ncbi:hypothetical protein FKM82_030175, partial [Ascaphus truei]